MKPTFIIFLSVPPTKPEKLHISQIGSSWAYLQWESPSDLAKSSSVFSHYEIAVIDSRNGSGYVFPFNPMCINMSSFNITDLQHETLYEFSVTTVAETCGILARSLSSNLVHSTTKFLGIILCCMHLIYGTFWIPNEFCTLNIIATLSSGSLLSYHCCC